MKPKKILIVRFSSIGDIVLTTPVIRCAKQQLPGVLVHVVTKEVFRPVLANNPYIDQLITFQKDVAEIYSVLQAEGYDLVIDLHKNLRSARLKQKLNTKTLSFNKLNLRKFLAVNFKMVGLLPHKHIVDRYFETVASLGIKNDGKGLDYFLDKKDEVNVSDLFFKGIKTPYLALVAGGSYHTKKIPLNKLQDICRNARLPVMVLGGKDDKSIGDLLAADFPAVINTCGAFSINQSASLVQQSAWVITSDTGLMHMASAFHKKTISVWGNTVPDFGMSPYLPQPENRILQVNNLSCRPCSKLGFKKCPRGHFRCMNDINYDFVSELK